VIDPLYSFFSTYRALDEAVQALLRDTKLLSLFYTPDAIVMNADSVMIFMAVLRTLKILPFGFTVDNNQLNEVPLWVSAMIDHSLGSRLDSSSSSSVSRSRAVSSQSIANVSMHSVSSVGAGNSMKGGGYTGGRSANSGSGGGSCGGGFFSSFMNTLEKGIMGAMDAFATKVNTVTTILTYTSTILIPLPCTTYHTLSY
jgi:RUN domain